MNAHPERIGPYKISRSIGEGGFGQVFEGFHESLQRRAAVKVLLPEKLTDRDTVARFVREALALATFKGHPGIVQVQHFQPPGQEAPYLAMELLEGKTLRQWLTEHGSHIDLNRALEMARQIAAIMVDVHAKELVHRDLKPENIILVSDEQTPLHLRPILLDFGIAKVTLDAPFDDQSLTQVKTTGTNILGSLTYMSPEQIIDADKVTPKADVYTLGIILYELLTGKPPFVSDSAVKLVQMHGKDQPTPLRTIVPTMSPVFSSFVAAMLAKEPDERPSMRDCQAMFARDFSFDDHTCPFPGLQPFNDSLQNLFFGRTEETRLVRGKLDILRGDSTRRWLQIQGPSGAGKSSFVHAAILPALDTTQWSTIKMRPGEDPIWSLAEALARVNRQNENALVESFRNEPEALDVSLREHTNSKNKLLLVIDQFEELFTLGSLHLATFERLLRHAFNDPESPLRLLTTIRSDYLHRFDLALDLAKLLDAHAVRYDLRPMDEKALSEVIEKMASRAGLRLTDGLTKRMVQDATGNDYRLPLVGHALRSLWALRDTGEITHADYEKMGGVGGALAKQAKELLESKFLGPGGREAAKWMLLDLVHVGQGAPDTRRPRMRAEIDFAVGKSEDALRAWKCLSGEESNPENREPFRLLVTAGDAAEPEKQRVELVHEMVLHKVPLVVEWINAERDFLELLSALESAAQAWFRTEKKDGLPSGTLLEHYRGGKEEARQARVMRMASERAREFLNEALRAEKRKKRIQIGIGAALVLAVLMIVGSAGMAWQQKRAAVRSMEAFQDINVLFLDNLDWELAWRAHTAEFRSEALTEVDEKLTLLEKHDSSAVYALLVKTKHQRSDFARKHETFATSYELLIEARRRIDAALEMNSNDYESRMFLAMHYSKHGKVMLAQGKYDGAFGDFERSVEILEDLRRKKHYFDEQVLATSQLERGDAEFYRKHFKEALAFYEKGVISRQSREKEAASDVKSYWRSMVSDALVRKARALLAIGDKTQARVTLEKADDDQLPLLQQEPFNVLHMYYWANIQLEWGHVEIAEKQWFAGADHFDQARDTAQRILAGDDKNKEYALLLIESLRGLEKARSETGDIGGKDEARAARCKIIQDFAGRDREDKRFDAGECK